MRRAKGPPAQLTRADGLRDDARSNNTMQKDDPLTDNGAESPGHAHGAVGPDATVQRLEVPSLQLVELATLVDKTDRLRYVPTASAVRPGDPEAIYVATQGGLILRFDLETQRFDTENPLWDFSKEVDAMRGAAEKYPRQKFAHLRYPVDFVVGMGM